MSSCPRHKDDNQALIMSIALKLLLARDLNIGHYKLQLYLLVLRSEYNQQKVNAPHKKLIKKNDTSSNFQQKITIAKTDNQRLLITINAVPIFFKPKNTGVQSVLNEACNAHKAKATWPSILRAARIPTYDKII